MPKILKIGIGARVMITRNYNVDDKIGTIGTIVAFNNQKGTDTIWMKPDDPSVGKLKQKELTKKTTRKIQWLHSNLKN